MPAFQILRDCSFSLVSDERFPAPSAPSADARNGCFGWLVVQWHETNERVRCLRWRSRPWLCSGTIPQVCQLFDLHWPRSVLHLQRVHWWYAIMFLAGELINVGNYCPDGENACECPAGTTSAVGVRMISVKNCAQCTPGKSQPNPGATHCGLCSSGYQCPNNGTIAPLSCPPGFMCPVGTAAALPCPPGQFNPVSAQSACVKCAAGSFSHGGNTSCAVCKPGFFSSAGVSACSPCGAGNFNSAYNQTTCSPCAKGRFSSGAARNCSLCAAGSYQSFAGQSTCTVCDAGTFATAAGATSGAVCTQCGPGQYSIASSSSCTGLSVLCD